MCHDEAHQLADNAGEMRKALLWLFGSKTLAELDERVQMLNDHHFGEFEDNDEAAIAALIQKASTP